MHTNSETFSQDIRSIKTQVQQLQRTCENNGILDVAKGANKLRKAVNAAPGTAMLGSSAVQVVTTVVDYHRTQAKETAQRTQVAADLEQDLRELNAVREALAMHFNQASDGRKVQFDQLFVTLDQAQATGDIQQMKVLLAALISLAQASPFKSLTEIRQMRRETDFVLEL